MLCMEWYVGVLVSIAPWRMPLCRPRPTTDAGGATQGPKRTSRPNDTGPEGDDRFGTKRQRLRREMEPPKQLHPNKRMNLIHDT